MLLVEVAELDLFMKLDEFYYKKDEILFRSNLVLVFKIDSALIVILHIVLHLIRIRLDIRELQTFIHRKYSVFFNLLKTGH